MIRKVRLFLRASLRPDSFVRSESARTNQLFAPPKAGQNRFLGTKNPSWRRIFCDWSEIPPLPPRRAGRSE